jgi:hypothetical protein
MTYRWAACILLLTACVDLSGLDFDFGPVDHVDVFPAQATVRVGDTTHMSADWVNKVAWAKSPSCHRCVRGKLAGRYLRIRLGSRPPRLRAGETDEQGLA